MVQNAIEKIINDTVKLPIIMELLIKNKGIKSSEYCFNKDFFIIVLTMLNMCQHSQQSTTISTQVKKTKSKQPNEKTKLKKNNQENKQSTATTFSSFLEVLVFPFQLLSHCPLFLYFFL